MNRFFLYAMIFLTLIFICVWLFFDIVIYVLVSLVISTILRPVTNYLHSTEFFGLSMPRILAVIISFVVLAALPVLFILLFVPLIAEQIQVLQTLKFNDLLNRVQQPISIIENMILNNFPSNRKTGFLMQEINQSLINLLASLDIRDILNYLLGFAGKILFYLIAVTFITFFFLYEKGIFRRSILSIIPNAYFEVVITTVYKIEKLLSNYLIGLLGQVTIMFAIIAIGLSILGLKYALTIAAFMAFINLIPYLGPALGVLFALSVVFSTDINVGSFDTHFYIALQMLPIFAVAIFLDNIFVQPFIFSKSVKAHPLEIFFAIFAGATLAGPLGMIAAIPFYTIIRVSFAELSAGYRQYKIFRIGKVR